MVLPKIHQTLKSFANSEKAGQLARFFKTGPGEYGEGDVFIGVTVPQQRAISKQFYKAVTIEEIEKLLQSEIHEYRLTALFLLIHQYEALRKDTYITINELTNQQKRYVNFYLDHLDRVNNRDLVDSSAHKILGDRLVDKDDRSVLIDLAQSGDLRRQRVAIIATAAFISIGQFEDTLQLSKLFLVHTHDLIHKAIGRMLREVGKKDQQVLITFLTQHGKQMPRTMLRYAIEKLEEQERKEWLVRTRQNNEKPKKNRDKRYKGST